MRIIETNNEWDENVKIGLENSMPAHFQKCSISGGWIIKGSLISKEMKFMALNSH